MNTRGSLDQRRRWLVLALSACAMALGGPVAWSTGQEAARAPAAQTAPDLLRSYPFDRITLIDNSEILVEPVSPRPLPPIDPEKSKVPGRGGEPRIDPKGNIGFPGEPSRFKAFEATPKKERGPDQQITVHLAAEAATGRGDARDFVIQRAHIKNIEYFEDMLLAEGESLAKTRKYNQAFERYLRVQARNPDWPGLDNHVDDLLFAEGRDALRDGEGERGLRLLRELHARRPDYPKLLDEISAAYAARINRAFDLKLYPLARRVLHELELLAPEHSEVQNLRGKMIAAAKARAAEGASNAERLDALTDALRVWPALEGAEADYVAAFEALPTLDVAVVDVPSPLGPWVRGPADARVSRLVYQPILADDSVEAKQGKVAGQIASKLESTDLGRRLLIQVKPDVPWSDGSRPASAVDVARSLIDRCDPRNPDKYQARWAELLERVAPRDEREVEVRLNRPLLKESYWLGQPVGPAHAGPDGRIFVARDERPLVGDGPFVLASTTPNMIELRARTESAGDGAASPVAPRGVHRLREFRYDRPSGALAAFVRGDVSLLARVPPDQVPALEATPDVTVGRYARPAVHVLALDGRNPALRNRMMRRALSYAVDRKALLEEAILKRAASDLNAPADGVFVRASPVDAPGVQPLEHNPILAAALAALAKGELGNETVKLKLEYPAIAEVEAVIPRLVEAFRLARIEVEPVELPESQLESELRAGRRFDVAYRVLRSDEPVLDAGPMICPGYDAPPSAGALGSGASPRIIQLLLQLDRAAEWPSANGLALQIDRELRDELPVIPLWQVSDHYAWRGRLTGPSEAADHLYQGIETWEIAPWVAKDPWTSQ